MTQDGVVRARTESSAGTSFASRTMMERAAAAMVRWLMVAYLVLAAAYSLAAQNTPQVAAAATGNYSSDDRPQLTQRPISSVPLIGPGDLIKVSVFGAPESDQEVRVGADGNIVLNFIGPVYVADLTSQKAQDVVAERLKKGGFFVDPQVSILIKEYATQGVSVLGEVQRPGVYPVLGARRLFDVLSLAGGTTDKAGKRISITRRSSPQLPISVSLTNDSGAAANSNVDIFPGDTVFVSKAGIVYVMGEVHRPSGVVMTSDNLTVLQALALAEGVNPDAKLEDAKIIRKTPDGREEIPLPLKRMLSSKAPDLPVQADDIIFVPTSAARSVTKRTVEAIVQAATGVAVYRR